MSYYTSLNQTIISLFLLYKSLVNQLGGMFFFTFGFSVVGVSSLVEPANLEICIYIPDRESFAASLN